MKDKKDQNLLSLTYKIGEVTENNLTVSSYSDTYLKIQNEKYEFPICIVANNIFQWKDKNYLNISLQILNDLYEKSKTITDDGNAEVILVGLSTGKINKLLSLKNQCMKAKLPFEVMKHDAACRTINILSMEGRKIIAILI